MHDTMYKTAYLSLDFPLTDALKDAQRQVCERYALIPRSEVHLTIAFFGEISGHRLAALAGSLMDSLPSSEISEIQVDGLGGAYEVKGERMLVKDEELTELKDFPRVLWLAVSYSEQLRALRNTVQTAAASVGIDTTGMSGDFFPHLTLGSAGPEHQGDWSLWDVHNVPKQATIEMTLPLQQVRSAKLHLTDVSIHPNSAHVLRAF